MAEALGARVGRPDTPSTSSHDVCRGGTVLGIAVPGIQSEARHRLDRSDSKKFVIGRGDEEGDNTSSSSLSITSYNRTDDGQTTITAKSSIVIKVSFPAVLLKILPTNKEKAEETAGNAIRKTIEKDVDASMISFEKAYMKFAEEASESE